MSDDRLFKVLVATLHQLEEFHYGIWTEQGVQVVTWNVLLASKQCMAIGGLQ